MHFIDNLNILVQAPVFNLALIIDGLMIGAVFALAAYGLALVWGVMSVKNLAQGDFVMMGGYTSWFLWDKGVNPLLGVPLAFVILGLFGWIVFHLVIKKVIKRDLFTSLLATFGLAIFLQQSLNIVFGPETRTADAGFESWQLFDGAVTLPIVKVIGLAMAAVLAGGVVLFMKKTRMGQAIRATSQDARAARVLGIDTEKVYAFTFSLNAAICGAAGALIAMIWVIQPFFGIVYSIRCFVIVTAAGLGNLPGVIAVGLGMGVIEQYGGFVLGAQYQQAIIVLLLLLVLIIRQIQQTRLRQAVQ
jgi:branched-chain amino acid transport system permease protein